MNHIPSLPFGLSIRDLEPRDPDAEYRREVEKADDAEKPTRKDLGLCHCMIASLHASRDLERGGCCDCHHCQGECYCK